MRGSLPSRRTLSVALLLAAVLAPVAAHALEPASAPAVADGETAHAGELTYLLWFTDEPVTEVAQAVLGDALGLTVQADGSVTQIMSFRVDRPMTRDGLLAEFREALAAEGVYVSRSGRTVVLSTTPPAAAAAPSARPVAASPSSRTRSPRPEPERRAAELGAAGAWPLAAAAGLVAVLTGWVWRRLQRRREPREAPAAARPRALHFLLQAHSVSDEELAHASAEAARRGVPLERALVLTGAAPEKALAEAYAAVTGYAIWRPAERPGAPARDIPPALSRHLRRARCVPVQIGSRLVVAVDDPSDVGTAFSLAEEAGRPVVFMVGTISDVADALGEPRPAANAVGPAASTPLDRVAAQ